MHVTAPCLKIGIENHRTEGSAQSAFFFFSLNFSFSGDLRKNQNQKPTSPVLIQVLPSWPPSLLASAAPSPHRYRDE